jgi:hypothetical protein
VGGGSGGPGGEGGADDAEVEPWGARGRAGGDGADRPSELGFDDELDPGQSDPSRARSARRGTQASRLPRALSSWVGLCVGSSHQNKPSYSLKMPNIVLLCTTVYHACIHILLPKTVLM